MTTRLDASGTSGPDREEAARAAYLDDFVASLRPLTPAEVARVSTLLQPPAAAVQFEPAARAS